MKTHNTYSQRFYTYYHCAVCFLILSGIFASLYLAFSHYRVHTDILYSSFCAISKAYNCDTVSMSPYSIFLGVPLPWWGMLGYGFLFAALLWKTDTDVAAGRHLWMTVLAISLLYSGYNLYLAYISTYKIESYCAVCVFTYGVNFFAAFTAWMGNRLFSDHRTAVSMQKEFVYLRTHWKKAIRIVFPFALAAAALIVFFPHYWDRSQEDLLTGIPRGMTEEKHPWIGAENPFLVITEFTDYQCFQCYKIHYHLRKIIHDFPDTIRLVHRHFPMDHEVNPLVRRPYHVGSGILARIAIHAAEQGKFWEVNDKLFVMARKAALEKRADVFSTQEIARQIDMDASEIVEALNNREYFMHMNQDLIDGIRMGVTGTPVYVIDGKIYPETLPWEKLKKVIQHHGG